MTEITRAEYRSLMLVYGLPQPPNPPFSGAGVQSGAAYHSLGFEDENFWSFPGWWAATVATYCPSRMGELPKFLSSKL